MTTPNAGNSPLATPTLTLGIVAVIFGALSPVPGMWIFAIPLCVICGLAAVIIGHTVVAKSPDRKARIGVLLGYGALALIVVMLIVATVM